MTIRQEDLDARREADAEYNSAMAAVDGAIAAGEPAESIQALFERVLEQTFGVSEGIWLGTPVNLTRERQSRELELRMAEILHPHLVLWGERDGWIAPADLRTMAAAMPDCRLVIVPGIGHSMNLEVPALYAGYFGAWFGGLAK